MDFAYLFFNFYSMIKQYQLESRAQLLNRREIMDSCVNHHKKGLYSTCIRRTALRDSLTAESMFFNRNVRLYASKYPRNYMNHIKNYMSVKRISLAHSVCKMHIGVKCIHAWHSVGIGSSL